jgi:hypothetical protein
MELKGLKVLGKVDLEQLSKKRNAVKKHFKLYSPGASLYRKCDDEGNVTSVIYSPSLQRFSDESFDIQQYSYLQSLHDHIDWKRTGRTRQYTSGNSWFGQYVQYKHIHTRATVWDYEEMQY